jgi:3,4-dihydroxy 2-butanone 4-phosphate synthase
MSKNTDVDGHDHGGTVHRAVTDFAAGRPVLVFDASDREGETDIFYPAWSVSASDVARLRNDAGGLVCVALAAEVAETFDLPFLADELDHPSATHDPSYDDRSSFSLTVNHRDTFTGITDADRALTISRLAAAADNPVASEFDENFRSPGHVHLLRAADGLLRSRRGHTELAIALADAARVSPAVVVCEMLDDETGGAVTRDAARAYATRHDLAFLTGDEVVTHLADR